MCGPEGHHAVIDGSAQWLKAQLNGQEEISSCRADCLCRQAKLQICLLGCRDNILFGKELFPERYQAVLKACALEVDVQQMAQGDATLIGDRGVTLSGGQRARLSLARAIYQVRSLHASPHQHIICVMTACIHVDGAAYMPPYQHIIFNITA